MGGFGAQLVPFVVFSTYYGTMNKHELHSEQRMIVGAFWYRDVLKYEAGSSSFG